MVNQAIRDEELMLLLSPTSHTADNELPDKPKLTMKLLYELIQKLKEENIILTHRLAEYERRIDLLLESKSEVASTMEMPFAVEHGTSDEVKAAPNSVASMNDLVPRAVRHPEQQKSPLWLLLARSAFRSFFRRRKGYYF